MSIETTKASELHQANVAWSARALSARDPIHDLVDKLQRSQSMVARVDPALGASIRAAAAQVDMPGRVDDPMFRTKVASARIVSYAATNVIVEAPQQPTAGFLRVVRPTGEKGWIEAGYLRP